jgi:polyvinyl alcohol dehydrogenase (cytochrome)
MELRLQAAACAALILASVGSAAAATCTGSIDTSSKVLASGFAYNLASTRNNPSPIYSFNVASLKVDHVNIATEATERRGAPIVTEQTIYTTNGFNVVAINRETGCQYWSYKLVPSSTFVGGDKVRSIAYVPRTLTRPALVVAGDNTRAMYAINAKTGQLVWQNKVGTDEKNHKATGTPQYHSGKLIVPVSSKEVLGAPFDPTGPCCKSHGMVQAVDVATGNILWSYHTTADATPQPDGHYGPNGAPVWASPTIDVRRNSVYIGTGQNYTHPTTKTSDAIIALDFTTGRTKWTFQAVQGDAWNGGCALPAPYSAACDQPEGGDHDFGTAPVLATMRNGQNVVLAASKNGVVYALNPDNGVLLWSKRVGKGSNLGGVHWGIAVDSDRAYVGVSDVYINKIAAINSPDLGQVISSNMFLVPDGKPGVYALDLFTGHVVWEDHPTHVFADDGKTYPSIFSAAPSVTNDVVFFASLDGMVRAYRTTDGANLWSYQTAKSVSSPDGVVGKGGTVDQIGAYVAGRNVLVNSGYNHFGGRNAFQAGPGNALYVFKLPSYLGGGVGINF